MGVTKQAARRSRSSGGNKIAFAGFPVTDIVFNGLPGERKNIGTELLSAAPISTQAVRLADAPKADRTVVPYRNRVRQGAADLETAQTTSPAASLIR